MGKPNAPRTRQDQMPSRIEPCLALSVNKPPTGAEWTFEVKWEGYRLAVHKEPSAVRIITRGGHEWTERFPSIAARLRSYGAAKRLLFPARS